MMSWPNLSLIEYVISSVCRVCRQKLYVSLELQTHHQMWNETVEKWHLHHQACKFSLTWHDWTAKSLQNIAKKILFEVFSYFLLYFQTEKLIKRRYSSRSFEDYDDRLIFLHQSNNVKCARFNQLCFVYAAIVNWLYAHQTHIYSRFFSVNMARDNNDGLLFMFNR